MFSKEGESTNFGGKAESAQGNLVGGRVWRREDEGGETRGKIQ